MYMDCVAIGDSIAVGIGQAAGCVLNARVGASSSYVASHVVSYDRDVAVISAGSNDPNNPSLKKNLQKIRAKIISDRVVWILPYDRSAARIVKSVAVTHGDGYIDLGIFKTRDGVHPSSYASVAKKL